MSVLAVDVERELGTFKLTARFEAAGGVTGMFGPSGSGKTTIANMIAGLMLCFARALGEFGATITFVSNIPGETQTISAAIYTLLQVPGGDAKAAGLVLVAIVLALTAVIASEFFARRAGMRFQGE